MAMDKRKDGVYRFRVRKDGQNYSMTFYGTEIQAQRAHYKFENDVLTGMVGNNENMLFVELAQMYLDKYVKPKLTYSTQLNTIIRLNNHILPELGNKKIGKINRLMIQDFVDSKLQNLSSGTVLQIASTINSIFKYAVKYDMLKRNPYEGIEIRKKANPRKNFLNDSEIKILFDYYANTESNILRKIAFYLAATCGLRVGEILALKDTDFDFINKTVTINKQISRLGKNDNGSIICGESSPKTLKSNRVITVPDFLLDMINEYIKSDKFYALNGNIMYSKRSKKILSANTLYMDTVKVCKKLGITNISFHDLRHLHATLLIACGANIASVSSRLGHSEITTTLNVYTHAINEYDQALAETMNTIVAFKKHLS